jgi:putative phosphoserine phosphatase/1-acylglycerol-3-phosphate O-acyltransferase
MHDKTSEISDQTKSYEDKSSIAAFIDLDGTLSDQYLWQALFTHHRKNRFKRLTLYAFIAVHTPIWLMYESHLISQDFFYRLHGTNLAWFVRGVSIERAEKIWEWVIKNQIIPHLRPEMLAASGEHKSQAHRVILISGSYSPLLDQLTLNLGVEGAIATPLAVKNGYYTGKILPPLNIGQGKVERLKQYLDGAVKEIDLTKSFFYTDSIVDAPVMDLFGHPVAVYPDPKLTRLAVARGWPVIGDTLTK